ncbi:MAG: nitroreductase family protein [Euryarchaeota archaeon]|nr:nitroreductase family protein [Euryarchaeota archaeon]
MDVFDAIEGRRSVRAFKDEPVGDDVVKKIIGAGLDAPSAGNLQARRFWIVRKHAKKESLAKAALGQSFIAEAPVSIVVCADLARIKPYGERGRDLYCIQDSAASVQNMLLAIHALGLASCWVGAFEESEVSSALALPGKYRPLAILPIGVPARNPKRPKRHPPEEEAEWVL